MSRFGRVPPSAGDVTDITPGKKDRHKRVTTEHTERHGKGKLIRILFSVYFGGFRG